MVVPLKEETSLLDLSQATEEIAYANKEDLGLAAPPKSLLAPLTERLSLLVLSNLMDATVLATKEVLGDAQPELNLLLNLPLLTPTETLSLMYLPPPI
jgi:hypothetical protein